MPCPSPTVSLQPLTYRGHGLVGVWISAADPSRPLSKRQAGACHHPLNDDLCRWCLRGTSGTTSSPWRPHDSLDLVPRLPRHRGPLHPCVALRSLAIQGGTEPAFGNWANLLGLGTHSFWPPTASAYMAGPVATWNIAQHSWAPSSVFHSPLGKHMHPACVAPRPEGFP